MRASEAWRTTAQAAFEDDLMYLKVALKQTGVDSLFYGVQLALTIAALSSLAISSATLLLYGERGSFGQTTGWSEAYCCSFDEMGKTAGIIAECMWSVMTQLSQKSVLYTLLLALPLLSTNLVATTLVGLRIWLRITIKIEEPKPLSAYNVVNAIWLSLAGIYPTFVVLAVAVKEDGSSVFRMDQSEAPSAHDAPKAPIRIWRQASAHSLFKTKTPASVIAALALYHGLEREFAISALMFAAPTPDLPLNAHDVATLKITLMRTGVDLLFYGVQAPLFVVAMVVLAYREKRRPFIPFAVTSLFLSSTIGVAVGLSFYILQLPAAFHTRTLDNAGVLRALNVTLAIADRYNYVMSDAIVVWRALVLWKDCVAVKWVLGTCICSSILGAITECVFALQAAFRGQVESTGHGLVLVIPLLLTNLVATSLIAVQFWYYRRDVKGRLGIFERASLVEKVIVLFVESGLVICSIWAVNLIIKVIKSANTFGAYGILGAAYHSISGIYPTFIVLVIALQKRAATRASCEAAQSLDPSWSQKVNAKFTDAELVKDNDEIEAVPR
ncbi:uncharacterized protein SCHCODRAFT_01155569 [Schizophyllum commune H4-8]|nr:uncharacterized protein SCHCODRAFT_01155569 [Schizophyllum commune H4-8]KAI5890191.1 hypothetical protein SCHCODRAFT_01155569 [Schizophyllum commune H4-8]